MSFAANATFRKGGGGGTFPCPFCGRLVTMAVSAPAEASANPRIAANAETMVEHAKPTCFKFRRLSGRDFIDACKRKAGP